VNEYHTIANQMYTLDGSPRPEQTLGFSNRFAVHIVRLGADRYTIRVGRLEEGEPFEPTQEHANLTEAQADAVIAACERGEWPGEQN
jgi:hypothetical protein